VREKRDSSPCARSQANGKASSTTIDRFSGGIAPQHRVEPPGTLERGEVIELAKVLAREGKDGYPRGALFWNETAGQFVDILATRYAMGTRPKRNAPLTGDILKRLKEFVLEHLDGPLDVATLARMTHRSQFHFSRAFTRSVGVSPHRYVVHLRLRRAVEMVRDRKFGLAEIAVRTGFADQSHLTRWVQRVHGVSPTQIMARP